MNVPFNVPIRLEETFEVLKDAFDNQHLAGVGPYTKRCEAELKKLTGADNLITSSATHSLEMMALLLNISPGDEVILPSFTFVSTANAFILRGARLRFADNDEFGNIQPSEVERLMTEKTRAVVAVHYAGNSCDMNLLKEICDLNKVHLLEDAAQAIGSTYLNKPLGTFGDLGCFSFHETKNVGCGEGGSLIINNEKYLDPAEIIREKGTNRRQFLNGMADKYTWVGVGSSYVLSDLNSAYLYPQLKRVKEINGKRLKLKKRYESALTSAFEKIDARVLGTPAYNENPNAHMFAIVFASHKQRDSFIQYMRSKSIACPFHYVSLHQSPFGRKQSGDIFETLPNCERLSACLVRLPMHFNLSEQLQDSVIKESLAWVQQQ